MGIFPDFEGDLCKKHTFFKRIFKGWRSSGDFFKTNQNFSTFQNNLSMSNTQNTRVYGIAVTVLLLLAAGLGFFFWQKSKNYLAENEKMEAERQTLEAEKETVANSLDSLANAYAALRTENETLQGRVTSTAALVQQKETVIKQIRATSAKDLDALRAQVADLQKAKIEYETIISTLQGENSQLRDENKRLTGENTALKGSNTELTGQVQDLAKQLEEQIRKTQSASFRATSFRVELERRNDKLTSRAKKAREIFVSFDLADVPQAYQGQQKLYMVIRDEKGNPIVSTNPTKTTVYAPTGPVEIMAQQVKEVALEGTQRLTFNYKFDERLKAGNYVVAIYCDKGLLGASSFRLV
jgi:predicted  nucleic acid-binding Zn-ribbon protein